MLSRIEAKLIRFFESIVYFFVVITHCLIFMPFIRIKVEGKENIPKKGRYILAGNHQNFFDGFLLAYIRGPFKKTCFIIAKRSLKLLFWRTLARLIGSVLLGADTEDYQRTLKKVNRVLLHGAPVGIFPEGDISNRTLPRKFKGGVAKLSLDSKSRVIPVYLSGTYNLRFFNYWLKRPEILVKIGKPIDLYNYGSTFGNNLDKMAEFLREKVIELSGLKNSEIISKANDINHFNSDDPDTISEICSSKLQNLIIKTK